jgi:hypothetical protein
VRKSLSLRKQQNNHYAYNSEVAIKRKNSFYLTHKNPRGDSELYHENNSIHSKESINNKIPIKKSKHDIIELPIF